MTSINKESMMSTINSVMNFSTSVAQTIQQGSQQTAQAISQSAERLDRKKENITQQGLQDIQDRQAMAQKMDEARNKIDTYA
jgi:translation initiation factor 2B subunit (eIF-2B alpha/beta/delta family)